MFLHWEILLSRICSKVIFFRSVYGAILMIAVCMLRVRVRARIQNSVNASLVLISMSERASVAHARLRHCARRCTTKCMHVCENDCVNQILACSATGLLADL